MTSRLHLIFCLALALVAAAYKKSEVEVTSTGLANQGQDQPTNEEVVRRIKNTKKTETSTLAGQTVRHMKTAKKVRSSIFAGLLRTDRYSAALLNLNCNSRHGGADIGVASTGTSLEDCKKMCIADDACTCISHEASTGSCAKQRHCHAESCESSSLADTYLLHTTLTAQNKSGKYNKTSRAWPQFSFERSGGRDCTPEADNVTDFNADEMEDDLSVTQCLNKCLNTTGCKCVMYERYYQSACYLKANCPLPTFCGRSIMYDMYVHYDTPQVNPYSGDYGWMR